MKIGKMYHWIALIIVATVCACLIIIVVHQTFVADTDTNEFTVRAISGLVGSMISIVSVYMGALIQRNHNDKDDERE